MNTLGWLVTGGCFATAAGLAYLDHIEGQAAPCDASRIQTRPLGDPTTMTDAQKLAVVTTTTYQLACLGYGPVVAPTGDATYAQFIAAVNRFGAAHSGLFAAYGGVATASVDQFSASDLAELKAVDDVYRARVGAARASDYVAPTAASTGLLGPARHRRLA